MASPVIPSLEPTVAPDGTFQLLFGGGIHSRASEENIDPRECSDGQNFDLDAENLQYRNRKPMDLIGTVPNAGEIRGFATLKKVDGTIAMLIQADDTVYDWDGASTFTSKGTVSATAKLRGPLSANFPLDDLVLIADLNDQEGVLIYDGTTLSTMTHNLTGTFKARYITVSGERAYYGWVDSNGTQTPHVLVGSEISNYDNLSVSDRPASGIGASDPFFVVTPDLRGINGLVEAFRVLTISTQDGSVYNITGSDATDFEVAELYPRSGADGLEPVAFVGNDVVYGARERIESLLATQRFGDVENIDPSLPIGDKLAGLTDWTIVYNPRVQRYYAYAAGENTLWANHKGIGTGGLGLSPWVEWKTQLAGGITPTAMMTCLDPADGLEYTFWGDANGNVYRMEGSGSSGDGGSANILASRTSILYGVPVNAQAFNIEGIISYRKGAAATVTLTFLYAGTNVFNESLTITLPQDTGGSFYGGDVYYGGDFYYNAPFVGRLTRQDFGAPGAGQEFQVRVQVDGTTDFEINKIEGRFSVST